MSQPRFTFGVVLLTAALAACGTTPTPPKQEQAKIPSQEASQKSPLVSNTEAEGYRIAAQLLVDNGFDKTAALNVREALGAIENDKSKLNSLSVKQQDDLEAARRKANEITSLIINDKVKPRISPQSGYYDSTEAQRASNIALSSLDTFEGYQRRSATDSTLFVFDWYNDGCSSPANLGGNIDNFFFRSCRQHDFGYRNGKR